MAAPTIAGYVMRLAARIKGLGDGAAQAFLRTFGDRADALAQEVHGAGRYGRLLQAGVDALDAHGRNRGLPRVRNEPDEHYRSYLDTSYDVYTSAGAVDGLEAQFARLGYPSVVITTGLDLDLRGISAFGGAAGFFFVDIDIPNAYAPGPLWDGGALWDETGRYWDITEPYEGALSDLKAVIRRWKPGGRSCRYVRIRVDRTTWATIPVGELWEERQDYRGSTYLFSYLVP